MSTPADPSRPGLSQPASSSRRAGSSSRRGDPNAALEPRGAWSLLLLSAASGAADAFAFLCVGQVFAGVMTGNLVLLGASAAGAGEDGVARRVTVALVAYACGVGVAAWLTEWAGWRPRTVLAVEVALLAAAAVLWGLGLGASGSQRLGLLATMALAMGIQGRMGATPTNYFTGTLTSLVGRATARTLRREEDGWLIGRLIAVVAGAAVTALAVRLWPPSAAVAAAALASGALLVELAPGRRRRG